MEPLVSVVIPSYNSAHLIGETLESALAQTYPRLEIIVIDDGSTDDTERAVAPYRDRIHYHRQANGGLASARNAGVDRSSGELVAWLDADDLWNPEKVALQVAVLHRRPECVLVASEFSAFNDAGFFNRAHARRYYSAISRWGGLDGIFPHREELTTAGLPHVGDGAPDRVVVYWGDLGRRLAWGNLLHPPTVMFRREVAARAGGLERRFARHEDWEYFTRLAAHGAVAYIDHPLMRYRLSPGQMSGKRHALELALQLHTVLDALMSRDPSLRADGSFRRRLGLAHLDAASELADVRRLDGARHLLRSVGYGCLNAVTVKTAARLALPRRIVRVLRRHPEA